ncbi:hypothetical protein [Sphingobacterium pedocola]|nr:hypothetical protein [Sphingobacterium pedocola]
MHILLSLAATWHSFFPQKGIKNSSLYPFATAIRASSCYWQMAKATFVEL